MNIIILGAGAIGSLYGAKLSKFNDVLLIGNKQHADEMNKSGLKITGLVNKTFKLKAVTGIQNPRKSKIFGTQKIQSIFSGIGSNTLILLTTKVYDSKKAVSNIKNLLKKDTTILCLQNGLYSEDIVKDIVGKKCLVLRAITNAGVAFLKPGIIQYNSRSYTAIEKNPKSFAIAKLFDKCGLNAYLSDNIKFDMWKKLILNCVLNPLTAILRIENRRIADKRLDPLKRSIVEECLKVAKKDGIKFNIDFVKMINEGIKDSRNISSMLQDIMKGKKTEIDYLNCAVVKLGKKYGIKCPVNEALVMIIKEMEKTLSIKNNKTYKQY